MVVRISALKITPIHQGKERQVLSKEHLHSAPAAVGAHNLCKISRT